MLWSPREQLLINLIESVQADFTRKISKYQEYDENLKMPICNTNYADRLKDLKLYSLERRRERMQILYLYKVVLQAVPNPGFVMNYCSRNKLTFVPKVSNKPGWIHTQRNSSFAVIGPKLFNTLPKELRELPDTTKTKEQNIALFKKNIDRYLSLIPDAPGKANSLLDHEGIDYGFKFRLPEPASDKGSKGSKGSKKAPHASVLNKEKVLEALRRRSENTLD